MPAKRLSDGADSGPRSIGEYSAAELQDLFRWVKSDGKLRTDDVLARRNLHGASFFTGASRIDAVILKTITLGWDLED